MTRRLAVLALLLAGCNQADDEMFPIQPGGTGGTGGSLRVDAAVDASGDGGTTITGRVCLLVEQVHTLGNCAATGAGDLTVALGTETAMTTDTGSFTIDRPANTTNLLWTVTGQAITPSVMRFGTSTLLFAIDAAKYQQMLSAVQVTSEGGGVMMRISRADAPVAGATVATNPQVAPILYDGLDDVTWETTATGGNGVVWLPSVPVGDVDLTITAGTTQTPVADVPVLANAVTFVFAAIN